MRNARARKAILDLPRRGENCPQSFLLFSCFGRGRKSQSKFSCKRVQLSLLKLPSAAENVKKWCIYMNVFVKPNEQSSSLLEYSAMARKRLLKTNLWHEKIFCKFTGFSNDNHNKQQKSLHPEGIGKKSRGKKQKSEEQNRLLFCSSLF